MGDIIIEILKLRKLKFKEDKVQFEEAEKDETQYKEHIEAEKEKQQFELTEEEQISLKQKFRKASFICHPDKVNDELKDAAQKIFVELKAAYDANDLKKVSEILIDLEKGNYFKSKSDTITEKDKLKAAISKLRRQIKTLEKDLITIKQSETYKTLLEIDNWDTYFQSTKEKLSKELHDLQKEFMN